jgi:hypothetical protein
VSPNTVTGAASISRDLRRTTHEVDRLVDLFIDRGQGWKIYLSIHTEIGAGRAAEGE